MHKIGALIFVFLAYFGHSTAQEVLPFSSTPQATELINYVSNIDEFISHFNYKKGLLHEELNNSSHQNISREELLLYLFDLQDPRADTLNGEHKAYTKAKLTFIHYITKKGLFIAKDSNLYALLDCNFIYNNEPEKVELTMKYVQEKDNAFRWAISGVSAPCLLLKEEQSMNEYLSPVSDNLGFISLQKNLRKFNYINLSDKNYRYDPLSVFYFLVETGQLQLVRVNSMQYKYCGFPGWELTISEFNRKNANSGWLISNLINLP